MEQPNFSKEEVLDIIEKGFPWEPNWGKLIITINQESEEGEVSLNNTFMSARQFVLAAGERAFAQPGDDILLDMNKLTVRIPADYDNGQTVEQLRVEVIYEDGIAFAMIDSNVVVAKRTLTDKNNDLELDA